MSSTLVSLTILDASLGMATAVLTTELEIGETFQGSRLPDFGTGPGLGVAPVAVPSALVGPVVGGFAYNLTFPTLIDNIASGGGWYVRTEDASLGHSAPLPVWMDASLISIYTLGGRALRDAILDNKPLIDLYLAAVQPAAGGKAALAFQTSVYGATWNESRLTPGVLVKPYSLHAEYYEEPRGRLTQLTYSVSAVIRSNDAANEAEAIGQLLEALEKILNQSCYETMLLGEDTIVNGGMSTDHSFDDDFLDNVWASKATFLWRFEFVRYTG